MKRLSCFAVLFFLCFGGCETVEQQSKTLEEESPQIAVESKFKTVSEKNGAANYSAPFSHQVADRHNTKRTPFQGSWAVCSATYPLVGAVYYTFQDDTLTIEERQREGYSADASIHVGTTKWKIKIDETKSPHRLVMKASGRDGNSSSTNMEAFVFKNGKLWLCEDKGDPITSDFPDSNRRLVTGLERIISILPVSSLFPTSKIIIRDSASLAKRVGKIVTLQGKQSWSKIPYVFGIPVDGEQAFSDKTVRVTGLLRSYQITEETNKALDTDPKNISLARDRQGVGTHYSITDPKTGENAKTYLWDQPIFY